MTRADELFAQMGYDPAVAAEMGVPQFARLPEQGPIVEPRWPEWLPWGTDILAEQAMRFMSPGDVPSWQMPYPMPATQGERDVLGMLPVAGDVEDVRYLMEGLQQGDPAMAAMGGAAAMMPFVPASLLHTVYHGSPHIFDAFKLERIGTGEGAQAYGHGLYFAESPGVAQSYQAQLGDLELELKGMPGVKLKTGSFPMDSPEAQAMSALSNNNGNFDSAITGLRNMAEAVEDSAHYQQAADWLEMAKREGTITQGALYKVEIPDEAVGRMLDWDKPLSEQPESVRGHVKEYLDLEYRNEREAARRIGELTGKLGGYAPGDPLGRITGKDLYQSITSAYELAGSSREDAARMAADELRSVGIPGIRYDAGQLSGWKGKPSRNLVLFDESLAKIIERK